MLYYLGYLYYLLILTIFSETLLANNLSSNSCQAFRINEAITLKQAVNITIACNIAIQKAFLSRIAERYNLSVAEYKFKPDIHLAIDANFDGHNDKINTTKNKNIDIAPKFNILTPIGTNISFSWDNIASNLDNIKTFQNASTITIKQPLLKHFGTNVQTASVANSIDLNKLQILQLAELIKNEINKTIFIYRQIIQNQNQLNIQEKILDMSNKLLDQTKILIKTGRLAEYERIQVESQVASQEVNLSDAKINLKKSYLLLSNQLGVNKDNIINNISNNNLKINYNANLNIPAPIMTPVEKILPEVLLNNINFQNILIQENILKRDYYLAYDNSRWTLDLNLSYGLRGFDDQYTSALKHHLRSADQNRFQKKFVGIEFDIPMDSNPARKQALTENQVKQQQLILDKKQLEQEILSEVEDQLYQQKILWDKLQLAKKSVQIKLQSFEMAKKKYETGRLSSFELVRIQDDVENAKVNENASVIAYLNNHTIIDKLLNKTFNTWGVNLKIE